VGSDVWREEEDGVLKRFKLDSIMPLQGVPLGPIYRAEGLIGGLVEMLGYGYVMWWGILTRGDDDLVKAQPLVLAQHQHHRKHKHNGARHEDMHHSHSEDGLRRMVAAFPRLHRLLQIVHSRSSIPGYLQPTDRPQPRSLRPRSAKFCR
jgi:hypothetical protein